MNDMKLIMENWNKYSTLTEQREDFGNVFLFENNQRTKIDFVTLLENKNISDRRLTEILLESYDYELDLVLKENILDNITGFFKNALNKAKSLLERGKLQGLILLNKVKESAMKLQQEHPKVAKAIVILVAAAAAYFLMDFLTGAEAHAAVVDVPVEALQTITGAADSLGNAAMQAGDVESARALKIAVDALRKAHQVEDEMQFSQIMDSLPEVSQESLRHALGWIADMSKEAQTEGGSAAADALRTAQSFGEIILKSKIP